MHYVGVNCGQNGNTLTGFLQKKRLFRFMLQTYVPNFVSKSVKIVILLEVRTDTKTH